MHNLRHKCSNFGNSLLNNKLYSINHCSTSSSDSDQTQDSAKTNQKIFYGEFPSKEELNAEIQKGNNPYLQFISQACTRAKNLKTENPSLYTETHHVVPRHEGGSDDPSNLVDLTYDDHTIAHYIRWIQYGSPGDYTAFRCMAGQDVDVRLERARLGGKIGGPIVQQIHRENKTGWFNSEGQRERGKKGEAVNKQNGTGAYDPANLEKANQILQEKKLANPEKYANQNIKNLEQGRKTIFKLEKGINTSCSVSQRLKSLKRVGYIELEGKLYSLNTEHRIYICETTLEYYLHYAPKPKRK